MILIPKPQEISYGDGFFTCAFGTYIVCGEGAETFSARLLEDCIRQWAGLHLPVTRGKARPGDIFLGLDSELKGQEYMLSVKPDGVRVLGGDGAGLLYGVQTLCQMVEQQGALLPVVRVRDYPQISRRGYYLDQTRGRVLKLAELKRIADRLCRYKLNEFQLYVEHTYLFRDLSEMWRDTSPLTAEEILELDDYCAERHIDLVPSLASFGHLYMLLSTRSHEDLCELWDASSQPFSFVDRMRHHTVNVSDERTLPLIQKMLEEYMSLFRSDRFNLCADETFDLGKGKSAALAAEKGIHRIYVDYLKELCDFVVQHGKKPMFWGDVICGEPLLARELPRETICLTWGYAPDQREEESRRMAEAGIRQYLCPGVSGWNQWMNQIGDSYRNITRMCGYARKYRAEGVLNTDWGDFGHINHPAHSVVGMIYGAAFSWNGEEIPGDEINRQISMLEYRDGSGRIAGLMEELAACCVFGWYDAVVYYETMALEESEPEAVGQECLCGRTEAGERECSCEKTEAGERECSSERTEAGERECSDKGTAGPGRKGPGVVKMPGGGGIAKEKVLETAGRIQELRQEFACAAICMDSTRRGLMQDLDVTAEGMDVWNHVGGLLTAWAAGNPAKEEEAFGLAQRLEKWFTAYREVWRESGKEGELSRIAEIVFWYADLLRGRKRERQKKREIS